MEWFVYVLKSEKKDQLYKGMTSNIDRRIKEHNMGQIKSTKSGVPWKLIYSERCDSRAEAREREKFLKSGDGRKYLKSLS